MDSIPEKLLILIFSVFSSDGWFFNSVIEAGFFCVSEMSVNPINIVESDYHVGCTTSSVCVFAWWVMPFSHEESV